MTPTQMEAAADQEFFPTEEALQAINAEATPEIELDPEIREAIRQAIADGAAGDYRTTMMGGTKLYTRQQAADILGVPVDQVAGGPETPAEQLSALLRRAAMLGSWGAPEECAKHAEELAGWGDEEELVGHAVLHLSPGTVADVEAFMVDHFRPMVAKGQRTPTHDEVREMSEYERWSAGLLG